jgi:hypothetical protein
MSTASKARSATGSEFRSPTTKATRAAPEPRPFARA